MNKKDLKPASVFEHFALINAIPRPSKREEKIIAYLKEFGESRGLETIVDETGNVLIRKNATPGYEDRDTIILQSHMDMVCEKLPECNIDFDNDPIETYVDGEWLCAKGTTLGADDGIGIAMELALLDADDIEHGPIECVFTRDEETGLTGAEGIKAGFMTGKMLINLDSEDEGQIFVSCAGGKRTQAIFRPKYLDNAEGLFFLKIGVKQLTGGHSGDDINKKRANSIKILSRFIYLMSEKGKVLLGNLNAGGLHNAIPRDGEMIIAVPAAEKENVRAAFNVFASEVEEEYHVTEPNIKMYMESAEAGKVICEEDSRKIILALQGVDNGVLSMCQDKAIEWLVETSSNLASVKTQEDGSILVTTSQRSNVMSALDNMCNTVRAVFQLAGAEVDTGEGYPAWKMNPDSKLTKMVVDSYKELFGKEPQVLGIHAGLECGLFAERYPDLDMVSMGPTLRGVHSPDERLLIPTVDMVWRHLLAILKK